MRIDRDELRRRYEALGGAYEGYIQMSGSRIEHLFKEPATLPAWESLHGGGEFIYEMVLYEPSAKRSVLVRQIDDAWYWTFYEGIDWEVCARSDRGLYYSVFDDHRRKELRMIQMWEKHDDPLNPGFSALELTATVFAGFDKGGRS